jgi:hypothetical protein
LSDIEDKRYDFPNAADGTTTEDDVPEKPPAGHNGDDDIDPPRIFLNRYICPTCENQWEDLWFNETTDDCGRCETTCRVSVVEEVVVGTLAVQAQIDAAYDALVRALRLAKAGEAGAAFLVTVGSLARAGEAYLVDNDEVRVGLVLNRIAGFAACLEGVSVCT